MEMMTVLAGLASMMVTSMVLQYASSRRLYVEAKK